MTFRYKKIHQRQKYLQNKIDTKISNEIQNVQQVLKVLVNQKQNQSQGQGQVNSNTTNTTVKEDKLGVDYKTKAVVQLKDMMLFYILMKHML